MRPPLRIKLFVRNAKGDAGYLGKPGVHHLLTSPAGGAFGPKVRSGVRTAHQGWDLYAEVNTPIVAIADGEIVDATRHTGYGQSVILRFHAEGHDHPLYALYGHLCHAAVAKGQPVKEGDVLGFTGTDGNAHGQPPHLHFEIRTVESCPYDPNHPLRHRISPGEVLGGHYRYDSK